MTKLNLEQIAARYAEKENAVKRRIIICGGTGCIANGSLRVRDAMIREMKNAGIDADIELRPEGKSGPEVHFSKSGCQGFCQMGPILRIEPEGIFYGHVREEDAAEIVQATLINGEIIERLVYVSPTTHK
ncbi:MAG: (2Fe-2S) ferredoxin domain-containing protein, partial [Planctomycetia bacterium]|nr:(2Fe-2S) ferredoxin domain-containing protein [Planctomycetia bacterium]